MLFFILSTIVLAQDNHSIKYSLRDIESKNPVKDVLIDITAVNKNTGEEYTLSNYLTENSISIDRDSGNYKIIIKADDLNTAGKDFYFEDDIELNDNLQREALLFSVGTLRGSVLDELDNLVKSDLKFECSKNYGEEKPLYTDKYGFFNVDYMPIGECRIIASQGDSAGKINILIEKGKISNLEIKLEKLKKSNIYIYMSFIVLILLIFFLHKLKSKAPKKQKSKKQINKRSLDIIKTLGSKEKQVVEFLLSNKYYSTQANIMHNTKIPKTTLIRILDSLKNKKIIDIEVLGKTKKIKLTMWFLEK